MWLIAPLGTGIGFPAEDAGGVMEGTLRGHTLPLLSLEM